MTRECRIDSNMPRPLVSRQPSGPFACRESQQPAKEEAIADPANTRDSSRPAKATQLRHGDDTGNRTKRKDGERIPPADGLCD